MAQQLQIEITGDARQLIGALRQSGVELDSFAGKATKMPAAAGGFGAMATGLGAVGVALGAVAGAGKLAMELSAIGAESLAAARTFENLSGGAATAAENMAAMQRATMGLVDTTTQQRIANQLMGMQIASTADELEQVVSVSRRLGAEFQNLGADDAANEFAIMMANMSYERLDTFGISSGRVRERVAELKETVAGMTTEQAFFQATMEAANNSISRLGPEVLSSSQAMAGLSAEWSNLVSAVGEGAEKTGIVANTMALLSDGIRAVRMEFSEGSIPEEMDHINNKLDGLRGRLEKLQAGGDFAQFMNRGEIADLTTEIGNLEGELADLAIEQGRLNAAGSEYQTLLMDTFGQGAVSGIDNVTAALADQAEVISQAQAVADYKKRLADEATTRQANADQVLAAAAKDRALRGHQERRAAEAELGQEAVRAQEEAARSAQSKWQEAFNNVKSAVGSVLGQGMGVLGDLNLDFMQDTTGRDIGENARRLASIAVGDFNGEAARMFAAERPELFKKIMESEDPAAAAQQMLQDFQLGIGAGDLIDKEAAKERIKRILLGTAETDALINEITNELMGEGFSLQQVQSAIGQSGIGGEAGGDAALANGGQQFSAIADGMVVAAEESNVMQRIAASLASSAAQTDFSKAGNVIAQSLVTATANSAAWTLLLDKIIEGLVGRGAITNPAAGIGPP